MGAFFINLLNAIIKAIGLVFSWVLGILPNSPFVAISNTGVEEFMTSLNWLIPISSMLAILEAWLVAVLGYYIVQAILRWVKAIE